MTTRRTAGGDLAVCLEPHLEPLEARMLLSATFAPVNFGGGSVAPAAISAPEATATSDFDNDGDNDLVFRDRDAGDNRYLRLDNEAANGIVPLPSLSGSDWRVVGVADFDGDSDPDLLFRNRSDFRTTVWIMQGVTRQATVALPAAGGIWEVGGAGDFTGDGIADIVWRNTQDTSGRVLLWTLDAGGEFGAAVPLRRLANPVFTIAGAGDFDGDGDADLFLRHASGRNAIWRFNQTGLTAAVSTVPLRNSNWEVGDIRDFDGDGEADIAWRHKVTSSTVIWFMSGNGTTLGSTASIVGLNTADWELPLQGREAPTQPGGPPGPTPWTAVRSDAAEADEEGAVDALVALDVLVEFARV